MNDKWQIWIDTGGTFTDCMALDPLAGTHRVKVLSSSRLRGRLLERAGDRRYRFSENWRAKRLDIFSGYDLFLLSGPLLAARVVSVDPAASVVELDRPLDTGFPADFEITAYEEAPVLAARLITGTPLDKPLPPLDMRLGSTKGTNALLEGKGARTALLITRGFADLIAIGTQQRPDLFQLNIPDPVLLYEKVLEVDERLDAAGKVLEMLTEEEADDLAAELRDDGFDTVAVALLHAYRNPVHEQMLERALRRAGIRYISLSHVLTPSIRLLPRARTALVNACLSPVIHQYLSHIAGVLDAPGQRSSLRVMSSAGGLVAAGQFQPKDSLLSGPAGGVVGAARVAARLGFDRILTLDMGGTSTDTARYAGAYDYQFVTTIDRIEMLSSSLAIETVAAGGGSVCYFDGTKLCVGPESAGASPGPACYGAGGPLTITDVNLLLGKLDPAAMGIPVRADHAREALEKLREEIARMTGSSYEPEELLHGLERIANEKMADAIRRISVARGFDPKDYALLAFGGAGGLHACQIADLLGMDTLLLPYDGGLLSAYGIGMAQVERLAEYQVLQLLYHVAPVLFELFENLARTARRGLVAEGFAEEETDIRERLIYLRFKGQDSTLELPFGEAGDLERQFEARYRQLFGHYPADRAIEVESIKVIAASRAPAPEKDEAPVVHSLPEPARHIPSGSGAIAIYHWEDLPAGACMEGPAILLSPFSTAFIAPGWRLELSRGRNAVVRRSAAFKEESGVHREEVELELFTNRFRAIAEEMGAQLQRTAFSVNIKERLDFSCALLDEEAELLVNAPHIPVHLGSLGVCARLVSAHTELGPGDVVLTNHPKYGGSHLPDVTMLAAVFSDEGERIGYVINRAHHAEIGGRRPGSMPPDASRLSEEGVVLLPTYLVRRGDMQWDAVRRLLLDAPYPTRALEENLADINAALASLRTGEAALRSLMRVHGLPRVRHYMKALKASAGEALREALAPFRDQVFEAVEALDDGHEIRVRLSCKEEDLLIDFSGTSSPHPFNLNANISIVYSAVIYVLRLLCNRPVPLNEGLMKHVHIRLPVSFLHPDFSDDPEACPAVVGGNTEVSQRLVDTLLKALGLAACSQGTMNNFLFGNDRFGYYETIGGGAGAGNGFNGRSGVHQHMTNTRITDPEELEFRYPVRLRRFALRRGSGGRGAWKGGEGIIRQVEFLEAVDVTILSQHRKVRPYGMAGGGPGAVGRQLVIRSDGTGAILRGVDSFAAGPGDKIFIETPGGGGYGAEAAGTP